MVWPNINTRLKSSQVVKNKNAIIEKGRNALSLVCSLFFNINIPPKDARTSPNSNGWWDQDISPSIPNTSWDNESPKPETIWRIEPVITSLIPDFREPWTDFLNINIHPIIAAQLVIETPVYTTIWDGLQKNSGSFWRCDMASQKPAETTMTEPITARIDTSETSVLDFANLELDNFWISFILLFHHE